MDEPGFHARRQAERDERNYRGGMGATAPMPEPITYGYHDYNPNQSFNSSSPGPPSPSDERPVSPVAPPLPPPTGRRRMNPPLTLMLGPILRYDTVVNNIYHAFAMIVTSDSLSVYNTPPTLSLQWDGTGGSELAAQFGRQLSLQDKNASGEEMVFARTCPGEKIHTYYSLAGPQSFWRFKLEIPLQEAQQQIYCSVNGGPENSFFVPAFDQNMRTVAYSCNGFSAGVDTASFNGPDPLWEDVLRAHEIEPIHVLIGGGDQIYCDPLTREPEIQVWIEETDLKKKLHAPLTQEISLALDRFLFNHYCQWFRSGAFGRAIGRIPMLNQLDDHDVIDGWGSYDDETQASPVFSAIGARGTFWFLLFQMFIVDDIDGTSLVPGHHSSKSVIIGGPGAWTPFPSHSFLSYLGPKVYILLLDCRAERKKDRICTTKTYGIVFNALRQLPDTVDHLIILLGVPIAYPRMGLMESVLESKLNPITAIAKSGLGMSSFLNKFDKKVELLDDMADHWCAPHHKKERNWFIEEAQRLAVARHLRVTFISGDVHAAAVAKLHTIKHNDPRTDPKFMLQIISSAIVNTPPPHAVLLMVSTFGKKRHKTLHYVDTDEEMVPMFHKDTDGSARKIETIMGRRNYCIITHQPSGDLNFDIRVETVQGAGTTVSYDISTPAPAW